MTFFEYIICVAMLAAFIVTLAKKWGFVEYLQVHGNSFFTGMANCDFCLSFWASCIVAFVFFAVSGDSSLIVVPFFSTMITRFVL